VPVFVMDRFTLHVPYEAFAGQRTKQSQRESVCVCCVLHN
jgi:hypothetical protein